MSLFVGKANNNPRILLTSTQTTLAQMTSVSLPASTIFSNTMEIFSMLSPPVLVGSIRRAYFSLNNTTYIDIISPTGVEIYPSAIFNKTLNSYKMLLVRTVAGELLFPAMIPYYTNTTPNWGDTFRMMAFLGNIPFTSIIGASVYEYTFTGITLPSTGSILIGNGDITIGGVSIKSSKFINVVSSTVNNLTGYNLKFPGIINLHIADTTLGSISLSNNGIYSTVNGITQPLLPSNNSMYFGARAVRYEINFATNNVASYTIPTITGNEVFMVDILLYNIDSQTYMSASGLSTMLVTKNLVYSGASTSYNAWENIDQTNGGQYFDHVNINNYTISTPSTYSRLKRISYVLLGNK